MQDFDPVKQIRPEGKEVWHLGVFKTLVAFTFDIDIEGVTHDSLPCLRDRLPADCLDEYLAHEVQTPTEFGKLARPMEWATLTAVEYRNLVVFYFPLVLR